MKRPIYPEQDYGFGQSILTLRTAIGFTQAELAEILQISRQSVAEWEAGRKYPQPKHLRAFLTLAFQHHAFPAGQEIAQIRALWKAAHQKILLDEGWLTALVAAQTSKEADRPHFEKRQQRDWDDAISVDNFFGRDWELKQLTRWLIEERCQVVTVLGLGGIGKSALVVQLMHQQAHHFDTVVWRSLRDAPKDDEFFADLLQVLAPQTLHETHLSLERRQSILLEQMRNHRVLLVFDNLESILGEGEDSGTLLPVHENFGHFLRLSAETKHQSCILLTSREKPKTLTLFESNQSPVRTLRLVQLDTKACKELLAEKGIAGNASEYAHLIEAYTGNPLALKIVAQTIADLFAGELATFLEQGEVIFGSIRELLAAQFNRLSALEQTVMFWLAILREPSTIHELAAVMTVPAQRSQLLEVFERLYRRSLIERGHRQGTFTLQSVVLEYVTTRLILAVSNEILSGESNLLINHAIELTQVREYVRQTQERLLAAPILEHLRSDFPDRISAENQLLDLIDLFRKQPNAAQGYGPANLVTLLRLIRGNLRGINMSELMLRSISLQGVAMQDASLSQTLMVDSVFTETFNEIVAVAVSQTGEYWAASSRRGEVRIWSGDDFILYRAWGAHTDMIFALAFSSDGQKLATGSWDRSIKVWDVMTGNLLWMGWHTGELNRVVFSPDDRILASTGGTDIILWDAERGAILDELPWSITPVGVAWRPDGLLLATTDLGGVISLWNPHLPGQTMCVRTIQASTMPLSSLAFSLDGKVLASSGNDITVKLWDVESGQLLDVLEGHTDRTRRIAFSPDGRTLASASRDRTICLWDFETRVCRLILHGHSGEVGSIAFSPDNQHLFSSSADGTLRVWDTLTGRCVRVVQSYATPIFAVDWSPDSKRLVSGGMKTGITIWDISDDSPPQIVSDYTTIMCSLGWSLDGRFIATSEGDHAVRLRDPAAWNPLETLQPPDENGQIFYNLAWSPDGQRLAWGTFSDAIIVFDLQTRDYHFISRNFPTRLRHVEWSPDGRYLVGCGYNSILYVWDSKTFQLVQQFANETSTIMCLAWNDDGIRLMAGGVGMAGGELNIWDVHSGERVYAMNHLDHTIAGAVWDVNDDMLITGGSDGKLRWWNLRHNDVVKMQSGHEGMIHLLRRSPDRTKLASCGNDGAVMLWDMLKRELIRTLRHDRPYERLDITGIVGLTDDQKAILRTLGAVENP
jgi:WD40 repeat protein/transcriptional regulator with XRE-family HTH domain